MLNLKALQLEIKMTELFIIYKIKIMNLLKFYQKNFINITKYFLNDEYYSYLPKISQIIILFITTLDLVVKN